MDAHIRTGNTRAAYRRAHDLFGQWCSFRGLTLEQLDPVSASAYIKELRKNRSPSTVKQHLSALRKLGDYLVTGGVLPLSAFAPVRTPIHDVENGSTNALDEAGARLLLGTPPADSLIVLRDRAILATMIFTLARISALVGLRLSDFQVHNGEPALLLHEKRGKQKHIPLTSRAIEFVEAYLKAAKLSPGKVSPPLFQSVQRHELTGRALLRRDTLAMVKRRIKHGGLDPAMFCNHSFRATWITLYLDAAANSRRPPKSPAMPASEPQRSFTTSAASGSSNPNSREFGFSDEHCIHCVQRAQWTHYPGRCPVRGARLRCGNCFPPLCFLARRLISASKARSMSSPTEISARRNTAASSVASMTLGRSTNVLRILASVASSVLSAHVDAFRLARVPVAVCGPARIASSVSGVFHLLMI